EVAGDVFERGLILTGGGAQLEGLPSYLHKELDLDVSVAEDPRFAIVRGLAQLYDEPLLLRGVARTEPHPVIDTEATAFETSHSSDEHIGALRTPDHHCAPVRHSGAF